MIFHFVLSRTNTIRWRRVAWNYMEVIGVIFYMSFIFERFLIPSFQDIGIPSKWQSHSLILNIFGCIMPATLANLCGFYCLLHAWMNAFGEMLQFADRMFYKDWWNASSFDVYYRTWNVIVHDWLYTYIYKDMYEIVFKESKPIAAIVVFAISAIVHEFILSIAFRFFYPVLLVMFLGCGSMLMFVRSHKQTTFGNIMVWMSLAIGNGLLFSLYIAEYFARQNCAIDSDSVWENFVPRTWRYVM